MSTARFGFLYAVQVKCTAFGRFFLSEGEGAEPLLCAHCNPWHKPNQWPH